MKKSKKRIKNVTILLGTSELVVRNDKKGPRFLLQYTINYIRLFMEISRIHGLFMLTVQLY
jgi:hypothetical protein